MTDTESNSIDYSPSLFKSPSIHPSIHPAFKLIETSSPPPLDPYYSLLSNRIDHQASSTTTTTTRSSFPNHQLQPTYYSSDQILLGMDRILGDCFPWSWLIDSLIWLFDYVLWLWKHLCPEGLVFQTRRATLPKELVLQILSRLPSTSVIRFRLVCKEWRLLTTIQSFIEMHQNNQPTPLESESVFAVQYFDRDRTVPRFHFKTFFINEKATNKNKKFQMVSEYIDLKLARGPEQSYHIDLLSSYKGFLLFTAEATWPDEEESALIFYNPVTKEQVTVIAPPSSYVYCGFFFHLPTNEYRILYQVFDGFEIFGFQTRSLRKIYVNKKFSAKYHPDPSTPAVISNGALHWIVSEAHHQKVFDGAVPSCSETILSFGMESEEFRLMPHPRFRHYCVSYRRTGGHEMNLLEMEGGVLCLCDGHHSKELNIFVMENYEKWTWVRRHVVPLDAYPGFVSCDYGLHVKAMQIHQGELLLYYHPNKFTEEYLLYPLNQEEEEEPDDLSYKFIKWRSRLEEQLDGVSYKFIKWLFSGSRILEEQLGCLDDNNFILKKKKKMKEKSRFKVVIDQLILKKNELLDDDQILRRIVIEHPGKLPKSKWNNYFDQVPSTSVGNIVVLTPSIASLKKKQHQTTTTVNGDGGNYILSLQYENHSTTLTEYNVQTRKWNKVLVVRQKPSMDRIISGKW